MSKSLSKIRYKLWQKNPKCFVCNGTILEFDESSIEHIIPKSLGGTNAQKNLAISHRKCNSFRGNVLCPVIWNYFKKEEIKKAPFKNLVKAWKEKLNQEYLDWELRSSKKNID